MLDKKSIILVVSLLSGVGNSKKKVLSEHFKLIVINIRLFLVQRYLRKSLTIWDYMYMG